MKISEKSLEFANHNQGNKPRPILFYVKDDSKKLNPLDYQTYKLHTNLKDEKFAVYNLAVKYYKVRNPGGVVAVRGHSYTSDQGTRHPGQRHYVLACEESTEGRRPT
eukprot:8024802-Ditylum_brightwellii.AAC.1